MRTGVIAKKVGMTRLFQEDGRHVPVTVLALEDCQVVSHRTADRDGYVAVQLGAGEAKQKNVNKPQREHFAKAEVAAQDARRRIPRRRTRTRSMPVGSTITRRALRRRPDGRHHRPHPGQGLCQGAMKRWGFGGMRATHGVSISHRAHGSTGQRQDPGKVFKNKKMAGHMGDHQRTQQNLEIVRTDADARPDLRQGLGPRREERLAAGPRRGQAAAARRRAVPRRDPREEDARLSTRKRLPAWSKQPPSTKCIDQVTPSSRSSCSHEQQAGAGDETTPAVGEENNRRAATRPTPTKARRAEP